MAPLDRIRKTASQTLNPLWSAWQVSTSNFFHYFYFNICCSRFLFESVFQTSCRQFLLLLLLYYFFFVIDGRNHVPCCIQEGIPDICQDVCQGEYTPITDNIKTMVSCSPYTEQTLACIVEGIGKHYWLT